MKKYVLCAISLLLCLSACGQETKPAETSASAPESDLQETTETASTEGTKETVT